MPAGQNLLNSGCDWEQLQMPSLFDPKDFGTSSMTADLGYWMGVGLC